MLCSIFLFPRKLFEHRQSVLKLYEDTKDFQKANFEFRKKSSKQEHLEMENKKYEKVNLYQQVMNQIEQFFKHK